MQTSISFLFACVLRSLIASSFSLKTAFDLTVGDRNSFSNTSGIEKLLIAPSDIFDMSLGLLILLFLKRAVFDLPPKPADKVP